MAFITLKNVCVEMPVYNHKGRSLKRSLIKTASGGAIKRKEGGILIRALQHVTLNIQAGDRVGLIGHNGAGKSTLLRVIGGIYEPVLGSVSSSGSITAMFDPNIGISPQATGYQNIYTRGILLGYDKPQIDALIKDVEASSGLGEYLDMPVRTYSAGMKLRLAFCVATAVSPEILLLDEAILAGDEAFMKLAKKRLASLIEEASILVLASHSQKILKAFCNKGVILDKGVVVYYGDIEAALSKYSNN
ncbi:MAG: ABC-type polysaccharide/polyol phosphate transport system ATPase subunit [Candidatus Azotimanducaceae bacterium]|jgi:ABC-type polysaccharide/polyol phosphate transport system ATPase subunit